jgi:hypothetical protein
LVGLYLAGAACELGGVILVAVEIWRDVLAARKLAAPRETPSEVRYSPNPNVEFVYGGGLGQILGGTLQNVDTFREFTLDRLTEGLRLRILGVALILLGAVVGLVANIGSLR